MAQLTTFSKTLIVIALVGSIAIFAITCNACLNGCGNNNHNTGYIQPQSQPQVITVTQPDGSSFIMNYLLWKSLMDNGGQTNVYNYYRDHQNEPEFQPQRQEQYRQQEEQVKTQKSKGFGSKPIETNKSNGFGSKPVETKKSNGFGTYTPSTSSSSSSTSTKSVSTSKSSGFGTKSNSTSTTKSSGFGKKKN